MSLFDIGYDPDRERTSVLFKKSYPVDTSQILFNTYLTSGPISSVSENVSSDSFWANVVGKVKSAVQYIGTTGIIEGMKDLTKPVAAVIANTETGQKIKEKTTSAISFLQSGLSKAIIFIFIMVVLFFLAKGYLSAKGAKFAYAK